MEPGEVPTACRFQWGGSGSASLTTALNSHRETQWGLSTLRAAVSHPSWSLGHHRADTGRWAAALLG